jgi:hypothetical protein
MNLTTIYKAASRAGLAGILALGLMAGGVTEAQATTNQAGQHSENNQRERDNRARVVQVFPPYGYGYYGYYPNEREDQTSIPQPSYDVEPSPDADSFGPHFYSHEETSPHLYGGPPAPPSPPMGQPSRNDNLEFVQ